MWNCQVGALLGGTTICLFDGSPGGPSKAPDWTTLWRFAALTKTTFFGAGAAFYASCLKAGVSPKDVADLSALRALGSTGSPLANECYRWAWDHCPKVDGRDIWLTPMSGGTDFAGAFIAGLPTLPMVEGEMQCRCLGSAVEAWSEPDASGRGRSLIDEVGELVCTRPMPSMPLYLWGDADGQRLHDSYFDMYPGIWRHGDWIRIVPHPDSGASGAIIYGRSDATINRHGVRMGTSELYRAVEALPEVLDSLVVDLEYLGRESWMPLFVVLREGHTLDAALTAAHQGRGAQRAVAAPRAERRVPGGGDPAHAVGQEDGAAGQEAADGRRPGQRAEARCDGQCRQRRLVHRAGARARSTRLADATTNGARVHSRHIDTDRLEIRARPAAGRNNRRRDRVSPHQCKPTTCSASNCSG